MFEVKRNTKLDRGAFKWLVISGNEIYSCCVSKQVAKLVADVLNKRIEDGLTVN